MIGTIITRQELLARWAFAEARSSRFGEFLRSRFSPNLAERISMAENFPDVAPSDWEELVRALWQVRSAQFFGQYLRPGMDSFVCREFTVTELLNSKALPMFGSIRLFRFLAHPPLRLKNGEIHRIDPRYHANIIPYDSAFTVQEPVIAIPDGSSHILIEGYLRSILWLRNPVGQLPVWLPL